MTTDLEERLRRYGDVLDRPALPVGAARARRGRPALIVAGLAAAVAAVVVAGFALRPGAPQVRVVPGDAASVPSGGAYLLPAGWPISRADEATFPAPAAPPATFVAVYRDPQRNFDGQQVVVVTNAPPELASMHNAFVTTATWRSPRGTTATVVATRLSHDELGDVIAGLVEDDAGHAVATRLPAGLVDAGTEALPRNASETQHAEVDFTDGPHTVQLTMSTGTLYDFVALVDDRVASGDHLDTVIVAGHPAAHVRYEGDVRHSAMWFADGVVYELAGDAGSADAFVGLARSLHAVDRASWEAALPAKTVKPSQRSAEVDRMLQGLPLPPGFDTNALKSSRLVSDRYQLGAQVTGAVACAWIDRWFSARGRHDVAVATDAANQLATAHSWPVLQEMNADGDYPEVLWEIVDNIGLGKAQTRADLAAALGCRFSAAS